MSFSKKMRQIVIIESMLDITGNRLSKQGIFSYIFDNHKYFFYWAPTMKPQRDGVSSIFIDKENMKHGSWNYGSQFYINTNTISNIEFKSNPLQIIIWRLDSNDTRTFTVHQSSYIAVENLISKLILTGVAVPSIDNGYRLIFDRNPLPLFEAIPPSYQMPFTNFTTIGDLWPVTIEFYEKLAMYVDKSIGFPLKMSYPMEHGARATLSLFLKKVKNYVQTLPKLSPITAEEWPTMFDEKGKMVDFHLFKERIYYAGADQSILKQLLPFLYGVYPPDSTTESRNIIDERLKEDYEKLLKQDKLLNNFQITNNKKMGGFLRVINHDVQRTDRLHPAFINEGPGLDFLTELLRAHTILKPDIGYVQGMNDLFVPIIDCFVPSWDENCSPVNVKIEDINFRVFWTYEAMLSRTSHVSFLPSVSESCKKRSDDVIRVVSKLCPLIPAWMANRGLGDLMWCYTDFVLLFKRTFDNIWPMWLQCGAAPDPNAYLVNFSAAVMLSTFDALSKIPNLEMTHVLTSFNEIQKSVEFDTLQGITLWLCSKEPPSQDERSNDSLAKGFSAFAKFLV